MIGVGQTLGNYHIVAKLGSGGMGAVYMAEHPLIGKRVALKVIHRELSMNREVVTRFFNEARAVNQIGNDHIVDISDFGRTPEGEYFFIMELLSGHSLGEVIGRERMLPVGRALHIAGQIADALGAAHQVGIIHRDLKPDNVFLVHKLGEPDFVKLLDFGLAKLVDDGGQANLTQKGVILGTPQYMSPEQCESKSFIDGRTDVYSLGVLLYQMTAGVLPFDGESMGEVLVKHVTQPVPPPRAINGQIPPSVEQIILRCLAKSPEARFQSMAALKAAFQDPDRYLGENRSGGVADAKTMFLSGDAPAGSASNATMLLSPEMAAGLAPARSSGGKKWLVALLILLFLGGGAGAVVMVVRGAKPAPPGGDEPVVQRLEVPTVRIRVHSEPSGAEVTDQNTGQWLGPTPITLDIRRDEEHTLVFRHPDHAEKKMPVRASTDAEVTVELQPLPRPAPVEAKPPRSRAPARRPAKDVEKAIDDDEILEPR